jgi:2-aminoethylphosphonate-pyruvate transaminase
LFTPGPVNVAANLRVAICREDICHRESEFDSLLQSIEEKLLTLFEIRNVASYRAVVITGSGTAANESILSSVVGDKNILVLSNGEFGERLYETSKIYNKNTHFLSFPWGEHLDLEKITSYLKENHIDIISMVHHETSSGMLNPLEKIGALSKDNNSILIVDCVSSAGAEIIDLEKNNIAFLSGSSSKAIGSYSGLSFVVGKKTEYEKLKHLPVKSNYLNLYKFYTFIKNFSQTPNTPAVHLFFALEQGLINILNEGISNRYKSITHKANVLRNGMRDLGLQFLVSRNDMCSILTTVYLPPRVDAGILRKKLRSKNIVIYEGKGCFKNRVFQVGNIGELTLDDIQYFLITLKSILKGFDSSELHEPDLVNQFYPLPAHLNGAFNNDLPGFGPGVHD